MTELYSVFCLTCKVSAAPAGAIHDDTLAPRRKLVGGSLYLIATQSFGIIREGHFPPQRSRASKASFRSAPLRGAGHLMAKRCLSPRLTPLELFSCAQLLGADLPLIRQTMTSLQGNNSSPNSTPPVLDSSDGNPREPADEFRFTDHPATRCKLLSPAERTLRAYRHPARPGGPDGGVPRTSGTRVPARWRPASRRSQFPVTWPRYFELGIVGRGRFFLHQWFCHLRHVARAARDGRAAFRHFALLQVVPRVLGVDGGPASSSSGGGRECAITGTTIAANATMLPDRFSASRRSWGSYWTLETELVFYVVCWIRLARRLAGERTRPGRAGRGNDARRGLPSRASKDVGVLPGDTSAGSWKNLPRHLGIMFWGAYFRIVYDGTAGFRQSLRQQLPGSGCSSC